MEPQILKLIKLITDSEYDLIDGKVKIFTLSVEYKPMGFRIYLTNTETGRQLTSPQIPTTKNYSNTFTLEIIRMLEHYLSIDNISHNEIICVDMLLAKIKLGALECF